MKGAKQTTLRHQVAVSGIGVHSGLPVTLTLHPADDDSGIIFQRIARNGSIEREIRATPAGHGDRVRDLPRARGPFFDRRAPAGAALRGL